MTAELQAVLDSLAVAATVLACWAAGAAALRPLRLRLLDGANPSRGLSVVEELIGGFLLLHLVLQALDLLGVPWHPLLLGGLALAAVALLVLVARSLESRETDRRDALPETDRASGGGLGLGDAAAAIAIAGFGLSCWFLRSPFSDFVYHWGLKAERSFLERGTDFELLARAANAYLHPDYPNLWPELHAVPAILSGRFHEPALLLLSALFLLLLALVLRAELERGLPRRVTRQLALAALVLGLAAFCIGYYQAGSADLPFALAVLLGASALAEPRAGAAALRAGLAAALAVALKIEGPPFAAILLGLLAWQRRRELGRRPGLVAVAAVPALLVIAPWAASLARYDLYQPTNSAGLGAIDAARALTIAEHAWRVLLLPEWHGLPLLLLLLPLLLVLARSRVVAALCGLQLVFYLYVYASAPLEPGYFVLSSFPRLVLHLVPALGLAAFLALGGAPATAAAGETSPPRRSENGKAANG